MIRGYITEDRLGSAVRISLVQEPANDHNPAHILRLHNDGAPSYRWEPIDPGTETQPTFTIHQDEARALLDALTRHFHGAEDTRALRRDYDVERERVDLLTGALVDVAQTLAGRSASPLPIRLAEHQRRYQEMADRALGRPVNKATDG
jgi:hypothetical protein